MGFKAWETPSDFFKQLDKEFHFTIDMASDERNHLCDIYATDHGTFEGQNIISDYTGLDWENWKGQRVFCNPPYDNTLYDWVSLAAKRLADVSVLLLPPSIDTAWFHDFIWANHWRQQQWMSPFRCSELRFLPYRLKFWRPPNKNESEKEYEPDYTKPSVPGPAPRAGNMIAIWKK